MKRVGGLIAGLALAGFSCAAFAQALPPGSYQQSCSNIGMQGSTLSAVCRATDGRGVQTALNVANCVGDIGNNNGQLQCNGGQPAAYPGRGYSEGGYPGSGYPASSGGPGYPPPGYAPPPGYGQGYGQGYGGR